MIKLGTISRRKGLLSLMDVKTDSPFLKRVCTLIADAADEETLRSAMRTEIESMQMRHYIVQDVFRKMAMYADYLPLVDKNSLENRARNRRVEFVLEKEA